MIRSGGRGRDGGSAVLLVGWSRGASRDGRVRSSNEAVSNSVLRSAEGSSFAVARGHHRLRLFQCDSSRRLGPWAQAPVRRELGALASLRRRDTGCAIGLSTSSIPSSFASSGLCCLQDYVSCPVNWSSTLEVHHRSVKNIAGSSGRHYGPRI